MSTVENTGASCACLGVVNQYSVEVFIGSDKMFHPSKRDFIGVEMSFTIYTQIIIMSISDYLL